ncbi:uncharacterized protein LOC120084628 [Benincasa hispida]|uniref:uncharacterized protein LOC120084628 n=1 Tax=Benincasa hispida TaxID=102211 RepID=UPI0018FF8F3D|nr:uncharacterized protein LOC120084628 [Benincasa hispida]
MDFDNVYDYLKELFPEIDHRILRAVALENPKDVHLAVTDVLTEVIPRFRQKSKLPSPDPGVEFASKIEVEKKMQIRPLRWVPRGMVPSKSGKIGDEACSDTSQESGVAHLGAVLNQSVSANNYVASDDCELSHENTETTSLPVPAIVQEDRSEVELNRVAPGKSNGLIHEDSEHNDHEQSPQINKIRNQITEDIKQNKILFDGVIHSRNICDLDSLVLHELLYHDDRPVSVDENSGSQTANPSFENHSPVQSVIHLHSESDYQESNANGTSNPTPKQECSPGEITAIEDGLMGHTIITQSSQPCSIDLLDKIIEDAKSNKVLLFVVSLIPGLPSP